MVYRRARGHMIEVYKIVNEIYDSKTTCNILKYRDKLHLSYENFGVHVTCVVPDRVLWTFSTCKP